MSNDGVVNQKRRRFLTGMTCAVGAVGVGGAAIPFVGSWFPSARAKTAGAPVKIDIGKIEPGAMMVEEWRGQPVYIVRRPTQALESLENLRDTVKDPESEDSDQPEYVDPVTRAIKAEFLIMLGLCTHLGCAPKYRPEVGAADLGGEAWLGGFFCPCHGSKFDLAGRVYKDVPAPTNLKIPPHNYESDTVVVIGIDPEATS